MPLDFPPAAPPSPAPARPPRLLELFAMFLLWNAAFKGARVLNLLFALELGAQPFDTGLLLATYGIVPLVAAVLTGKIADRYGPRLPVSAGFATSAVSVLLPFAWPALPSLYAAAAVAGAGFILVQVAMQSFVGSLGAGAERTRNINYYALVVSVADLVGPVLAGFSIDHLGHVRSYLAIAALNGASLLALAALYGRFPASGRAPAARGSQQMGDLLRKPALRRIIFASGMIMSGLDLFQLYIPVYGHAIGLSASAIGALLGAFAVAEFVTRTLTPWLARRFGERTTLLYALALAAAMFTLIPLSDSGRVLAAICFFLGLGMGLGQPLTVVLTYNCSPPARVGEALGLRIAVNNTMHVGVPALFGAVGSLLGLAPVFWIGAAVVALGGLAARASGAR